MYSACCYLLRLRAFDQSAVFTLRVQFFFTLARGAAATGSDGRLAEVKSRTHEPEDDEDGDEGE